MNQLNSAEERGDRAVFSVLMFSALPGAHQRHSRKVQHESGGKKHNDSKLLMLIIHFS